jgi:IS30 family transposase
VAEDTALLVGRYGRSHLGRTPRTAQPLPAVLPVPDATTTSVVTAMNCRVPPAAADHAPITWDRGVEMTRHAEFTAATGIPVYICDA